MRINTPDPFTSLPSAVEWSHVILSQRLRPGDLVVDATAGNGHDTVFLAQRVLPGGRVFAFDIQAQAIEQTWEQITKHKLQSTKTEDIVLHHAGHERIPEFLPSEARGRLRAVMFNLGYLPGGDKVVITRVSTTLSGLQHALDWLAGDGVLTIVAYPGHEGGREEADAVERLIGALPSEQFEAQRLGYANFRQTAPFCLAVRKRA